MKISSILKTALLTAGLSAFALVGGAHAQVITWSAAQAVDPNNESNISTTGTELDGIQGSTGGASTITLANGAFFNPTTPSGSPTGSVVSDASGDIVFADPNVDSPHTFWGNNETFADPNYGNLMAYALIADGPHGNSSTLTFNNLTLGNTYQVEVVSSAFSGHSDWTMTLDGTTPVTLQSYSADTSLGQLAIGTFTATGTSMTENITAGVVILTAVQIREIAEVPEPSTYALMGLGALALLVVSRRRKA